MGALEQNSSNFRQAACVFRAPFAALLLPQETAQPQRHDLLVPGGLLLRKASPFLLESAAKDYREPVSADFSDNFH